MICLHQPEIDYLRDTLTLLLAVHSHTMGPAEREAALAVLAADGATTTEGARVAILGRILKISEKFL